MLTGVDDLNALVQRVLNAQSHNALLRGDDLAIATDDLARIARDHEDAELVAADTAGDRIIGAATVLHPTLNAPADLSQRLDGRSVLLVSGVIAGPIGLMQTAARLRSLGATGVRAAVLGGWKDTIPGIDELVMLRGHGTPGGARRTKTSVA
jgi:hypothetical protein